MCLHSVNYYFSIEIFKTTLYANALFHSVIYVKMRKDNLNIIFFFFLIAPYFWNCARNVY